MRSVFVTGTDTGVGKTVVAAGIAAAMLRTGANVGVMKPVATGGKRRGATITSADAEFLIAATGVRDPLALVNPISLEPPMAPYLAARITHKPIELPRIWKAFKVLCAMHHYMVVEGVGGLMVPIQERYFVADMIQRMKLPVIVVTRPTLGTINHTVLTVTAARQYGLDVIGLVVNYADKIRAGVVEKLNPEALEGACNAPVLAEVPHLGELDPKSLPHEPFDEIVNQL